MRMKKLSESFVTAAEAKESLSVKDVEQLTYEQKICLDFLKKYVNTSGEDSRKLVEELKGIGRIDERQATMIANVLPMKKEDVDLIFSKERTTLSSEEINKVLETVKKYTN